MGQFKDLTGQRFGRLVVVFRAKNDSRGNARWICECECGNMVAVTTGRLRSGHTQSCGCRKRDLMANTGRANATHKLSFSRLYNIWHKMKQRCLNSNHIHFKNYGGRGIAVCDEWREDFKAFYDWAMRNGYADNLTIDRIDNDGNYCPSNCRWVTAKQQQNNLRKNRLLTFDGETHSVSEWARLKGIKKETLFARLRAGWSIARALEK